MALHQKLGYKLGKWIGKKVLEEQIKAEKEIKAKKTVDKWVKIADTQKMMDDILPKLTNDEVLELKHILDNRLNYKTKQYKKKETNCNKLKERIKNKKLYSRDLDVIQDELKKYGEKYENNKKESEEMTDKLMKHDEAVKNVDEKGWDGFLEDLQDEFKEHDLYAVSQSWYESDEYICKARGERGDVIIGWEEKQQENEQTK